MPFILFSLLVLPMPLALAARTGRRFAELVPLVLGGASVAAYLLGLAGGLFLAPWLFLAGAAAGWIYLAVRFAVRPGESGRIGFVRALLRPDVIAFCGALALLWWICRGRCFIGWDEFSHWGLALKGVLLEDKLPCLTSIHEGFKEYPPAASLFQYILLKASGLGLREDAALFAQDILALSFLFYPLHRLEGRRGWQTLPAAAVGLFFLPLVLYMNFYTESTVDGLLGVLWGFLPLVWFLGRRGRLEQALLAVGAAQLCLTKSTGPLLAAMAFAVMLLPVRGSGVRLTARLKSLWPAAAAAVFTAGSWKLLLILAQVPKRWSPQGLTLESLWELLIHHQPDWRVQVIRSYAANLAGDWNYGGLPGLHFPYLAFFLIGAALTALVWKLCARADRSPLVTAMIGMGVSLALYVGFILMGYLFWFTETEALLLASLSRYLNTGVTACLLVLAGFGLTALGNLRLRGVLAGTAATALLWVVLTSPWPLEILDNIVHAPDEAALTVKTVAPYHEIADRLCELPAEEDGRLPVYLIAQQDAGLAFLRVNYELAPLYLDEHATSIGSPYGDGDLWTQPCTAEEWGEVLGESYQYVYLYNVDSQFAAQFLPLFDGDASIVNGNLLQVETTDAGVHLKVISTAEG